MGEPRSVENGLPVQPTRTRVEYGVLVDRTSRGLGYMLAATYSGYDAALAHAMSSPVRHGYPAEVKARTVTTTGWTCVNPHENG